MKTIARLGLLALLLSIVWAACTHEPDVPPRPEPKPDTTAVDSALLGKWYLLGSGWRYDMDPQPLDTVAYVLEFGGDGSLHGYAVNGSYTLKDTALRFKLYAVDEQRMPDRLLTYRKKLLSVYRYTIYSDGLLRLYYDNDTKYLLFDKKEPAPPVLNQLPRALLATWRINEYRLIEDRVTRDLSNSEPIQLRFNADTTWTLQVSSGQTTGPFRTDSWTIRFNHRLKPMDRFGSPDDRRLLESLREVVWYELKGDGLTLYFSEGAGFISCQKVDPETGRINEHLCRPWKLVGFGHTADGSVQIPEEGDNLGPRFFMLEFRDNGVLYTRSSTNMLYGDYSVDGQSLHMDVGAGTKVSETKEGKAYIEALHAVERFELQKDGQLKLFYNQGRDYLLFRDGLSLVSSPPPAELLGKWTLAEIRYSARPPVVFKPGEHTITFHKSGYIDIEGYKLFGSIPEDQLSYGYHPWGKENTLFIGWTYFIYNLEGETLTMTDKAAVDGPNYVFKRLRK